MPDAIDAIASSCLLIVLKSIRIMQRIARGRTATMTFGIPPLHAHVEVGVHPNFVEISEVDGTAAEQNGSPHRKGSRCPIILSGAKLRVHLVPRRHVSALGQRTVGGELAASIINP